MDQESVVLEVDPRSVHQAIVQANKDVESWEKGIVGAGDRMQKSLERMADLLVKVNDKSRSSMERLTQSIEKQAAAYGKTGVDRLVAERDRLIKKLGDEQAMVDRVRAAYEKMIAVEQKKDGGGAEAFGKQIEQMIRDPLNGAKDAAAGLLEKVGTMGASLAAGVGALTAIAAAGWEAAKSLGEYGTKIRDAELRTGLAAKEVGQFEFAAKAVGQDISVVERLMRGLSQAADDTSREGEKARATMQRLGIELRNSYGEMKPTSEILTEISDALNKLPEGLQRDAAAMDLFKRVGVEAIPFMTELNENLRIAHEQGFGPTEDDVRRFTEYQQEVAELQTKWDALMRQFKEGLVTTLTISINWVGAGVKWFLDNIGTAGDDALQRQEEEDARQLAAAGGVGAHGSRSAHRALQSQMEQLAPEIMRDRDAMQARIAELRQQQQNLVGNLGVAALIAPTEDEKKRMAKAAEIQKTIDGFQQTLDEAERATRRTDLKQGKAYVDSLRARFFGTHDGMEQAYQQAKKDFEKYQKQLFEPEHPLTKTEATDIHSKLIAAQAKEFSLKAAMDTATGLKAWERQATEEQKKAAESGMDAVGKLIVERDLFIEQGKKLGASDKELATATKAYNDQILDARVKEHVKELNAQMAEQDRLIKEHVKQLNEELAAEQRQAEQMQKARDRVDDIGVEAQREALRRHATAQAKQADTPEDAYRIRVDLATQLAQIEVSRILREEDSTKRMVMAAEAQKQLYTDLAQAQDQLEEQRAAAAEKAAEEVQHQVDEIQKTSSNLLHTLFTKPQDFAKQLGNTLHEAVLKPITEGLGGMFANAIHPLIFGADGQGGIGGMFKGIFGGKDPVKASTDLNTAATAQNSAALAMLTAVLAGFMGIGTPMFAAPSIPGITGIALPAFSAPAPVGKWGGLPKFADGGITNGPAVVGEAGPELVIPLTNLRNMGLGPNARIVGHYGPETDVALQKAAGAMIDIALPAGLTALAGPAGLSVGDTIMSLLVGGAAAATPPRHDDLLLGMMPTGPQGGARFDPEVGKALFGKTTIEQLAEVGRKGGRASALARRLKAMEAAENQAISDAMYRGPEPGPIETTHEARLKIDAQFPHLAGAFDKSEAQIKNQLSGRAGGRVGGGDNRSASVRASRDLAEMRVTPGPNDPYYTVRWVINPRTGEIALTKIGRQYEYYDVLPEHHQLIASKGWPTSGRAYDLMHRGQASIARDGTVLDLGDQSGQGLAEFMATYGTRTGFRPITNDQAKELLRAIAEQFSKGRIVRRLPSYDNGGTVGSTGLAVVHQGEAVVPQADTLKRSIDNLTGAMNGNASMFRWLISSMFSGRMASYPLAIPSLGSFSIPSIFFGGGASTTNVATSSASSSAPAMWGGAPVASSAAGGYTPAPWAWSKTGLPQSELGRIENMVSGGSGSSGTGKLGLFTKGGFTKALSNLKGAVWNQDAWEAYPSTTGGYIAGGIQGAATSPAAGMAGLSLAMSGLTGDRRGTWTGSMESAAGGALIGDQIGGPLGAAAGASFGFEVSMFEKLFGVESPENEAKRLVKQLYSVSIDNSIAKQIVSLAQQKYAGHVSIAVRDPDVRKMLMLYSEATGQKMPLSATTPQSASLAETGGRLYQQATYVNGTPYTFQSNLPVLGGYSTGTYPTPSPMSLQLNISGQGAAQFVAGQVVTPEFVQAQWSSAGASSNGRLQNSAMIQQPGLVIS
jgi:hypothetical protein